MKKIVHKNQIIITALALMIAVAGYFSYMNNNVNDKEAAQASVSLDSGTLAEEYEISDEDSLVAEEIFTDEEMDGTELAYIEETETIAATDGTGEDTAVAQAGEADGETVSAGIENPGEAVLTSNTISNIDYASQMKLNREQIRSKNKETLLEIVNNTSLSDDVKQEAVTKMIAMTDIAEQENAAEMLLEAKGFTDVVVSITEDSCDVVVNMGEVTDAKRAQIEDIIKRKTKVEAENIVITPIVVDADAQ